jgi:hypothetical protein
MTSPALAHYSTRSQVMPQNCDAAHAAMKAFMTVASHLSCGVAQAVGAALAIEEAVRAVEPAAESAAALDGGLAFPMLPN